MRVALLSLTVLAAAAPLAAQTNAERMTNDQYSRSHDYDLLHERIEIGSFNWDSASFSGKVTLTLVALRPHFDSVIVDAGKLLTIDAVTDAAAHPLAHATSGDTLVVRLSRAIGFGDTVRFSVTYHGHVEGGQGLTFIEADTGLSRRPRQLWSQGEDHSNHYWFPTYDFPNDKASWELAATVPAGFTAVSNGTLVLDRKLPGGNHTVTWREDKPSATYLVSLIVAPLVKISDTWKGVPVDYYVYREDSARARRLFHVTPDMIDVYSSLTGVKYPWAKYAQTTVADFFGGMENVSATTLVDWLPDTRAYADRPWYQYILIPHELAHQWFGDYVTTANWANMWLNEGFAEFMPGQYWKTKLGKHAEEDYYADEYRQFMGIDARRRMPLASAASNNIYPKGALVLEMLQNYLGPERFWTAVHRYLTDHQLGGAVTDDFRQAVLQATGENLDWFMDEWFYQAGYPEFTVTAAWDSTAKSLTLSVKQTQVDTSKADSTGLRYTTPAVFRMPVTVRVGTASGDVVHRDSVYAREQSIVIPNVASAPTMVIFDDGNTILKKLSFEQPTDWLAHQLAADPNLWNRQWVINTLGARKDAESASALATAATSADYYLTRSWALTALGKIPGDPSKTAIEAGMRDTSAQVREAAAHALGALAPEGAIPVLKNALEKDTSYQVRGAALSALVLLDTAGRRAMILKGLETPSYQNAIQNAALGGAIQSGDTTLVDAVAAHLGDQNSPAFVLAAFASHGSTAALNVLVQHLDDPRTRVAGDVLQAFEFGMPPAQAISSLTAAQGSLKTDASRDRVSKTIERLQKRPATGGDGE
ncbi:MAG: M1 family aminopeptidase [Gemmatimonadota bacterium]